MGIFEPAAAALRAAEWAERNGGPNAAIPGFRAILWTKDPAVRVRAVLGLIRCSVATNDPGEVITQSTLWSQIRFGSHLDEIIDLCKALLAKGHTAAALALAAAEADRDPQARAFYLHARCLERAGDPQCLAVYLRAAERASAEPGAGLIGVASRVRRIERFATDRATLPQAIAEAQAADPEQGTAAHKLVIAAARLASASRFTRASGLSILEDLAKKARPSIADRAMRMAAENADAHADALSAMEVDRIAAILKNWRDPKEREGALARLRALERIASATGEELDRAILDAAEVAPEIAPSVRRAQAIVAGGLGSAKEAGARDDVAPELARVSLGLDIVAALRRGLAREAEAALARASLAQKAHGGAAPPAIWTGVHFALRSPDRGVQQGALALAEALLGDPGAPRPPPSIKLGSLAASLRLLGRVDLAESALRGAATAKEPGAAGELAVGLLRQGWSLAERGDRDAALEALREAKALAKRATKSA